MDPILDVGIASQPFAFGGPRGEGVIRLEPEDFFVDEITVVEPDGAGEHLLMQIEKRNNNTDWVAGQLARLADVPRRDVSYAGQKDRHAVTRQWFSVRLAGKEEPDWGELESLDLKLLHNVRHGRKLRTGALKGNRFVIRVRDFKGDATALEEVLSRLSEEGMPNYYGEQRFGRGGSNIASASALFQGQLKRVKRHKRSIYLSAARSLLFNRVLSARVEDNSWNSLLTGERAVLNGSHSSFLAEVIDEALIERCRGMDIHPSGPLWGRGGPMTAEPITTFENDLLADYGIFKEGLDQFGLKMERRALRAAVAHLDWSFEGDHLILGFELPKGSYATSLLREILNYRLP